MSGTWNVRDDADGATGLVEGHVGRSRVASAGSSTVAAEPHGHHSKPAAADAGVPLPSTGTSLFHASRSFFASREGAAKSPGSNGNSARSVNGGSASNAAPVAAAGGTGTRTGPRTSVVSKAVVVTNLMQSAMAAVVAGPPRAGAALPARSASAAGLSAFSSSSAAAGSSVTPPPAAATTSRERTDARASPVVPSARPLSTSSMSMSVLSSTAPVQPGSEGTLAGSVPYLPALGSAPVVSSLAAAPPAMLPAGGPGEAAAATSSPRLQPVPPPGRKRPQAAAEAGSSAVALSSSTVGPLPHDEAVDAASLAPPVLASSTTAVGVHADGDARAAAAHGSSSLGSHAASQAPRGAEGGGSVGSFQDDSTLAPGDGVHSHVSGRTIDSDSRDAASAASTASGSSDDDSDGEAPARGKSQEEAVDACLSRSGSSARLSSSSGRGVSTLLDAVAVAASAYSSGTAEVSVGTAEASQAGTPARRAASGAALDGFDSVAATGTGDSLSHRLSNELEEAVAGGDDELEEAVAGGSSPVASTPVRPSGGAGKAGASANASDSGSSLHVSAPSSGHASAGAGAAITPRGGVKAVPQAPIGVPALALAPLGELTPAQRRERDARVRLENSRCGKWRSMLEDWEGWTGGAGPGALNGGKAERVKTRCRKGIPEAYRGRAWFMLLRADKAMEAQPSLYRSLLSKALGTAGAVGGTAAFLAGAVAGAGGGSSRGDDDGDGSDGEADGGVEDYSSSASALGPPTPGGLLSSGGAARDAAADIGDDGGSSRRSEPGSQAGPDADAESESESDAAATAAARAIIGTITRDINRTFPQYSMFAEAGGIGQSALFHVLIAYAQLDAKVGYCQGMGFIAALFLSFMPEEQAFYMFKTGASILQFAHRQCADLSAVTHCMARYCGSCSLRPLLVRCCASQLQFFLSRRTDLLICTRQASPAWPC